MGYGTLFPTSMNEVHKQTELVQDSLLAWTASQCSSFNAGFTGSRTDKFMIMRADVFISHHTLQGTEWLNTEGEKTVSYNSQVVRI